MERVTELGGMWLVLLATLPIRVGSGSAKVSVFEVMAIPLLWVELRRAGRPSWPLKGLGGSAVVRIWLLFLVWAAVSLAWAPDQLLWAKRAVVLAEAAVAAWAVHLAVRRLGMRAFAWMASISGLLGSAIAIIWFYVLGANPELSLHPPPDPAAAVSQALRLGSPVVGPSNYFASFLLLSIPLAFYLARGSVLHKVSVVVQSVALVSTVSRGALYALILVGLVALPLGWRLRELRPRVIAAWLVAFVVSIWLAPRLLTWLLSRRRLPDASGGGPAGVGSAALEDSGRVEFLGVAFDLIRSRPLVGTGLGNWEAVVPPALASGAHNSYVQAAVETGLIGLALLLSLLWLAARTIWCLAEHRLRYSMAVAFFGVLVNSLVEASYEGVAFGWTFIIFLGAVFAARDPERST
ncbi:MAG TPA: O-antigen ligase family protein [Dermatophilaceae bacterium]|nr:O-antigen ligase family protein [Dermatophilaceae bacterium]